MSALLEAVRFSLEGGQSVKDWLPILVANGHAFEAIWTAICVLDADPERRAELAAGILAAVPWRSRSRVSRLLRTDPLALVRTYRLVGIRRWKCSLLNEGYDLESIWVILCSTIQGDMERAACVDGFISGTPRRSLKPIMPLVEASGIHPISIALALRNLGRGQRLIRKMYPGCRGVVPSLWAPDGWKVDLGWRVGIRKPGELPSNLKIPGGLVLGEHGPRLIPSGTEAGSLTGAPGGVLERIEPGLRVRGDLDLGGQERLAFMGDGIRVGGNALIGGSALQQLGKGFKVGGNLTLVLPKLQSLPPDLEVGGCLDVSGCRSLREVPSSVKATLVRKQPEAEPAGVIPMKS